MRSDLENFANFRCYIRNQAEKVYEELDDGTGYDSKYDVIITMNEQMVRVPFNADSFTHLETMFDKLIEEELELTETKASLDKCKIWAEYQDFLLQSNDLDDEKCKKLDLFICFDHESVLIHNPFVDETQRDDVDPANYYGLDYLQSGWITRRREIEVRMELIRQTAVNFLQACDPNGSYADDEALADFGEVTALHHAINYFIWYSSGIDDREAVEDVEDAVAKCIKEAIYMDCFDLLAKLSLTANPAVNYRMIWKHNIEGFKQGKFSLK